MDYQALIIDVLDTAFAFVLPVIGAYIVKWLNVHIGEKRTNLIKSEVRSVVESLEQQAAAGKIDKSNKFYAAFHYINENYKRLSEAKITHFIEEAVRDMKKWDNVPTAVLSSISATPVDADNNVSIQTPSV